MSGWLLAALLVSGVPEFCHAPDLGPDGALGEDFCTIWDEEVIRACPRAEALCRAWPAPRPEPSHPRRRYRPERIDVPEDIDLGWVGPTATALRWAGWALAALLLVAVLRVLIQVLRDRSNAPRRAHEGGEAEGEARASVQLRVESTREAWEALERGELESALMLGHEACLQAFAERGWVQRHESYTRADYHRQLAGRSEARGVHRALAGHVERVRYGDESPDEAALRSELRALETLLEDAKRGLFVAPALALLVLATSSTSPGCTPPQPGGRVYRNPFPTGLSLLPDVLREDGLEVVVTSARGEEDEGTALVLGSAAMADSSTDAFAWRDQLRGDTLLVDDVWRMSEQGLEATVATGTTAARLLPIGSPDCASALEPWLEQLRTEEVRLPRARYFHSTAFSRLEVHAVAGFSKEEPTVLCYRARAPDPWIYLFADRDLFTNASLLRASNRRSVQALFRSLHPERAFLLDWEEWTPRGDEVERPSPGEVFANAHLLPFVAHGLLVLAVLFVGLGAHFGRPRKERVRTRHAFVEHVDALGGWLGRTESGRALSARVLLRWLHQRHPGMNRPHELKRVAEQLSERIGAPLEEVHATLSLDPEGSTPTPEQDRLLSRLVRASGRGPGHHR